MDDLWPKFCGHLWRWLMQSDLGLIQNSPRRAKRARCSINKRYYSPSPATWPAVLEMHILKRIYFKIYFLLAEGQWQYCVGFCHMSTWISHRNTYVPSILSFPPTLGCHRALVWVPWVLQQILPGYLFYITSVYVSKLPSPRNDHFELMVKGKHASCGFERC